ncbi:MAG: hypothetical protein JKY42_09870 [Flavobacteriales bacterium]|nr:hypothetical protein [Flavobacteriales bacterium]
MFKTLLKKKITEEKLANIFVNGIIDLVDSAFPEVAALINEDSEYAVSPRIQVDNSDKFLLIVIAGNLKYIPTHFEIYQDIRMQNQIYRKLSIALGLDLEIVKRVIGKYQNFCSQMNHPSKNTLYAMSKGVFFKYELTQYQDDYFKGMNCPNPVFLKRLDEIMLNFIWDWDAYLGKYRVVE